MASTRRVAGHDARARSGWCPWSRRRPGRSGCCGSSGAAAPRRAAATRSSGSASSSRSVRAMASAVTTPQPPAVVTTATLRPVGQRLGGEAWPPPRRPPRSCAARTTPAWRHMPSKTRSSVASEPVWLAAARAPPAVAPPLTSTTGMRSAHGPQPLEEARGRRGRPRRRRARRRSRDRRRRTRGSRSRRPGAALPADTARLTPTPLAQRVVHERRHEVARLAGDADATRPAGTAPRSARTATTGSRSRPGRSGRRAGCRARRPARPARPGRAMPSSPASP